MCFVSEEQSNEHNKVAHSIKNTTVSSTATKKKTKIRTSNINRDKQRIMIEPSPTLKRMPFFFMHFAFKQLNYYYFFYSF